VSFAEGRHAEGYWTMIVMLKAPSAPRAPSMSEAVARRQYDVRHVVTSHGPRVKVLVTLK
jgi:hypothetical protein